MAINIAQLEKLPVANNMDFLVKPPYKGTELKLVGEGGWGVALSSSTKHVDPAQQFLVFLMGANPQVTWSVTLSCHAPATKFPLTDPACQTPDYAWAQKVFQVQDKVIYYGNEAGSVKQAESVLQVACDDLRAGKLSVEQAAKQANDDLTKQLAAFKKIIGA